LTGIDVGVIQANKTRFFFRLDLVPMIGFF